MTNWTAKDVYLKAREWVGTPYEHHGRTKGTTCDCVGLIVGVGAEIGLDSLYRRFDYSDHPKAEMLLRETGAVLQEQPDRLQPVAGEVVAITVRMVGEPQHLAIIGEFDDRLTLIHAFLKEERVVEHGLTDWWQRRIMRVYRYPGVTY